jgi:dipeptidyl aminopeptidase/acylaminoacyl peptidase
MNPPSDGFERNVSDWLHANAEHRVPEHLDAVLRRTRTERQRPAWSSLERWLPVQSTLHFAPVPRIAWLLVVLALVAVLGVAVLAVGSRSRQPAPPFGLARNGAILYGGTDGDIYSLDPTSGRSTAIVAGASNDRDPMFSRDGSRFVFIRDTSDAGRFDIMVANADGSGIQRVTGSLTALDWFDWSADGTRIVTNSAIDGKSSVEVVDAQTGSTTTLDLGTTVSSIEWRPDGRELVFHAGPPGVYGLYAVHPDGTGQRTIATAVTDFIAPTLSPDGTKVAYLNWDVNRANQGILQIVDVDTGQITTPAFDGPTTGVADEAPIWSPDSTRLAFERYWGGYFHIAVAPAAGGHVVETGPSGLVNTGGADHQFSPDGTKVFTTYKADGVTWILDAAGAPGTKQPPTVAGGTWQRLAP